MISDALCNLCQVCSYDWKFPITLTFVEVIFQTSFLKRFSKFCDAFPHSNLQGWKQKFLSATLHSQMWNACRNKQKNWQNLSRESNDELRRYFLAFQGHISVLIFVFWHKKYIHPKAFQIGKVNWQQKKY